MQSFYNQWIPLENCKSGEVLLSVEFKSVETDDDLPSLAKDEAENEKLVISTTVEDKTEIFTAVETPEIPLKTTLEDVKVETKEKITVASERIEKVLKEEDLGKTKSIPFTPVNIHVVVHKARNIEKKGMFGKADPYVTVKIGSESYKSVTIKNNHNPEWQFDSNFILDKNSTEDIIIEVFDEDIGKGDTLGEKCLNIKDILERQNLINQWVPL